MAENKTGSSGKDKPQTGAAAPVKPAVLRIATIVEKRKLDRRVAAAVMAEHHLKYTDRMEPDKFVKLMQDWLKSPAGGKR